MGNWYLVDTPYTGDLEYVNVVIPFDNQIGKDTSLYKLYNTNIHEKIAEQRAKEQQR